ncbi:MAG: tetratricopeptide repeat protein, partial [Desulfobacteraceae bacterium]|nr:tetratricopeptide repeat protein [Desulfobacteraceae bacterium]
MPIRSKKRQAKRHLTFWVTILLLLIALAGGWWLWHYKFNQSPRLNYIALSINHETRRILSGETLALHPNDRVKILDISTNIPFNRNIRLSAKGLDVYALQYEELTIADLLPHGEAFNRYNFTILVKHYNRDIGDMTWVVQPYTEDWLDKANRIIDNDMRLAILERGQRLTPENRRLSRRLLDEYKTLKKWKQAARMLEEMEEKKVDHDTLKELIQVYRAMENKDGTILAFKKLINLDPDNLEARRELVEIFEKGEDWNGAIREYEDLLKRTKAEDRLPVYKSLGYLYTKTGRLEKAISCYLNAAKIDQKDANLHYNLSYLYEKINQEEKSNFYLDNAITLRSGDLEGRLKLALSLMKGGKLEKARKHLSEVLKKEPASNKALTLMAEVMEKQGDKRSLKIIYRKIHSLNPQDNTIIYNLGALEYEEGNLKGALPYFKEYVKSHPADATVHGVLFDIYKKEKNLPLAFKEAVILVELTPKETDIYDFIFDYLRRKDEYEKIIPLMQKGLQANPKEVALREYLVTAYLKTGKDDQAVRQMEEILNARPKDIDPLLMDMFESLRAKGAYEKILRIMKGAVKA